MDDFKKAFEEDEYSALQDLFSLKNNRYLFRACCRWLAFNHPKAALDNIEKIPAADLCCLDDTPIEDEVHRKRGRVWQG